ncbi:MAG: hypothetical protein BA872_00265 [Desulfobacterales bacterium C00003060]|nr:MAG: hypothetical protein BA872_00265 [Desulfobacterales bacterium C00003060]
MNLLILEDNPDDAELAAKELEREGINVEWSRVDTEQAFRKTLAEKPDLILADYKLPSFDGMAALQIRHQMAPEIPIIIYSGTIGEEVAVECMKSGATDYVLKDRLSRLGPVVKRAMEEAEAYRDRKRAEQALRESEERLSQIVEGSSIPTFVIDGNHVITHWNKACENLMGISASEVVGTRRHWSAFYPAERQVMADLMVDNAPEEEIARRYGTKYQKCAFVEGAYEAEDFFPNLGERGKWLFFAAAPLRDHKENVIGAIETVQDITDRKQAEERVKYLSFHDFLTGLYNRAFFEEEMKRFNTLRKYPVAIIMADVNNLKFINDAFGHAQGDELLKRMANTLVSATRKEDVVARIGGDEFAVLLPDVDEETAQSLCNRITDACKDSNREVVLKLTVSLGYSVQYGQYKDMQQALGAADDHMYRDKLASSRTVRGSVVDTLTVMSAERDIHREEQSKQLQQLAISLGKDIGLSEHRLEELKLLVILYDIGKIGVPDSILHKPDNLTSEEWETMKKHCEIGHRIARNVSELVSVANDILCHHERWNGNGYPGGLEGEEIPLLARIISIVDAYDAMLSERPYRKARSKEEAMKEIRKSAGTQFDPELAERFLKIVRVGAGSKITG